MFRQSIYEMKHVRTLVVMALLVAVKVVLDRLTVPLTPNNYVTFEFLALVAAGSLLGPVPAMLVGALGDILCCILFPRGAYFPGFTVTAALAGLVYGVFLYKKQSTLLRTLWVRLIETFCLNIVLNSFWLYCLTGPGVLADIPGRIVKNLIMLPVCFVVQYVFGKVLDRIRKEFHY